MWLKSEAYRKRWETDDQWKQERWRHHIVVLEVEPCFRKLADFWKKPKSINKNTTFIQEDDGWEYARENEKARDLLIDEYRNSIIIPFGPEASVVNSCCLPELVKYVNFGHL